MIYFTILILFLQYGNSTMEIGENKFLDTCHMEEVDFWKFFYWAFKNSDHIFFETFESYETSSIIKYYLNELLLQVSLHGLYKKSFTITQNNLNDQNYDENIIKIDHHDIFEKYKCEVNPLEEVNATLSEVLAMVSKESVDNETQLQKRIRSFSADLGYRYIILVHNVIDLLNSVKNNWPKVFPNPRGIFVIVFISTEAISDIVIEELFKKIWDEYQVLNIIIQQPCTCVFKELFTYDPFYPVEENVWGLVKKFRIEDAIINSSEYRRSLISLNWHPLKISLFTRLPTAVTEFPSYLRENYIYKDLNLSLGYVGLDGMVLKTLCELLRLKPINKSEETDYGYEENGLFFGNLGEVANRTIDISFNSRFVEGVGFDVIEYLTPVINDKFCIIVPKALEVPHYLMIFHCFNWMSWLIIALTYLFASIYWCFVRPIVTTQDKLPPSVILSFLEVFCLFVSIPIRLLVTTNNHRIFFVACMIFNIIIIGAFQGSLVTSFSTTTHYPDINTLDEFDQSGLYIITASRSVQTVFGDDGTELFKKLNSKIKIVNKLPQSFRKIAHERNMASLERKADAILKIKMHFTNSENVELIHIVKDCPRSYHYTYILPKGSPYVHVFNIIITVMREAGFLLKWNSDIVDALVLKIRRNKKIPDSKSRGFSLDDIKIAFYILLAGNFLSAVVFIIEGLVWKNKLNSTRLFVK